MSGVLDPVLNAPAPTVYGVIAALVFAEAAVFVGFVLPGETAVLLGGVLAATGRVSLAALLPTVVLAAVAGDTIGYEVGRLYGPKILASRPLRSHQATLAGAQRLLRDRGGWAVFVGRFTAFLRAVMPGLAGLSRMPYPRFLAFNAAGGLTWGVGVTLLGYFAGHSYAAAERALGQVGAILLLAIVVGVLLLWLRHRRRRGPTHSDRKDTGPGRA